MPKIFIWLKKIRLIEEKKQVEKKTFLNVKNWLRSVEIAAAIYIKKSYNSS